MYGVDETQRCTDAPSSPLAFCSCRADHRRAGIAPEDQEAIFEEFRQVGTAAKKVEGTGLGLALSRKFIDLHGGRIWVQSQVWGGLDVHITIPSRQDL
jgi:signal transduction histidine kinase